MTRAAWWFRQALRALGWPGLAGIGLCIAAAAYYGVSVREQQTRLAELTRNSASLRMQIDQAAKSGIPLSGSAEELQQFYSYFPDSGATEWLQKLYAAAEAAQLTLDQGEYRTLPDKSGKLLRYQITLPVKGSYAQIRKFVDRALVEVPIASLDDIGFKREAIGAAQLEARIKLTLFLRTH